MAQNLTLRTILGWVLVIPFVVGCSGSITAAQTQQSTDIPIDLPEPTPAVEEKSAYLNGSNFISSLAITPDGEIIAAGDGAQNLWLWSGNDLSTPINKFQNPDRTEVFPANYNDLAFSPDGRTLAAGSRGIVYVFDMDDLDIPPVELIVPSDRTDPQLEITTIAFSPDGKTLVAGSSQGRLYFWTTDQLTAAPKIITGHRDAIEDVIFSPDGRLLFSGGADRKLIAWDPNQVDRPVKILMDLPGRVMALAITPDGKQLLAGFDESTVLSWSMDHLDLQPINLLPEYSREAHERRQKQIKSGGGGPTDTIIQSIAISPDGKYLVIARDSSKVQVWKFADFTQPYTKLYGSFGAADVTIAFFPSENVLVGGFSAIGDSEVFLWTIEAEN